MDGELEVAVLRCFAAHTPRAGVQKPSAFQAELLPALWQSQNVAGPPPAAVRLLDVGFQDQGGPH